MKVIILRGISGSGKTMLANKLAHITGMEHGPDSHLIVSADQYFTDSDGEYRYIQADQSKAHEWCLTRFLDAFFKQSILKLCIIDNTNTRAVEAAPYYAVAQAWDAEVRIITIVCDPQLAWERNNHGTSAKIIWAQHQRILNEQLPTWWKQEVAFRFRRPNGYKDAGVLSYEDDVTFDPEKLLEDMNEA